MKFKKGHKINLGKKNALGSKHKPRSKKWREKQRKKKLGRKLSVKTKKRMSEAKKGKRLSFKTRKKIGDAQRGSKAKNWMGGIAKNPYSNDWTATLRRGIKERDNYTCRLCGNQQKDTIFDIHHIDYNKKNCNPNNLITLCHSCHSKTNCKNRGEWIKLFSTLMAFYERE